jgi:hypothetical protein
MASQTTVDGFDAGHPADGKPNLVTPRGRSQEWQET